MKKEKEFFTGNTYLVVHDGFIEIATRPILNGEEDCFQSDEDEEEWYEQFKKLLSMYSIQEGGLMAIVEDALKDDSNFLVETQKILLMMKFKGSDILLVDNKEDLSLSENEALDTLKTTLIAIVNKVITTDEMPDLGF